MKKIFLTGIVILIAVFFVTCDADPVEAEIEYTDVVYSKDGSQVTVYLDGIGVPKAPAQRAMSLGLAEMAYDFIEVIFVVGTKAAPTSIARSQWELGESAGISGVKRDFPYNEEDPTAAKGQALMAVGTKDGKTLLGVGRLIAVDQQAPVFASWPAAGTNQTISSTTKYVVFGLTSVKTGLQAGNGGTPSPTLPTGVTNSLIFPSPSTINATSTLSPLGGIKYPMFALPLTPDSAIPDTADTLATYTFQGAAATYKDVLAWPAATVEVAKKRIPRYMESGRYLIPRGRVDTKTKVKGVMDANAATKNQVNLTFTVPKSTSGIFSFYIDVPVSLVWYPDATATTEDTHTGTNGGNLTPVLWHLRTGFGADLYSLDDGLSSGGCVLMGVNVGSLDWLEIQWEWEKPTT